MKRSLLAFTGALALVAGEPKDAERATASSPDRENRDWQEILGSSRAELPAPLAEVVWRGDVDAAFDEARASGRPVFVTLRCIPCKQCAGFDQAVLEGGRALDPLLAQFVTVRLTDAKALDLRRFPVEGFQDLDLSWWGWLMSPEGRIYSVFGGKDHVSDSTRISPAALANTLRRVLEHHYDPRRAGWDVDGPAPELDGAASTPLDLPGAASWRKGGSARSLAKDGCLHCHQVNEILRQPAIDARTFDKRRDLDVWPLPENVGLVLDRDDGLRVTKVEPSSAAARAGIAAGDRLAAAGGRKLFGQTDFRGVLHRGPRAGSIEVLWRRGGDGDGELLRGALEVRDGWRGTELGWRKSVADGNVGAHPGFAWPLAVKPEQRRKLGISEGAMAVKPFFGQEPRAWPAHAAGLRDDDVIVAVGGASPDLVQRDFMTWFRLRHEPGETVVLTVRDSRGRDRQVRYAAPAPGSD
jgi:serine protease Do